MEGPPTVPQSAGGVTESIHAHVRQVHARFALDPPADEELAGALARALANTRGPTHLCEVIRAGGLPEVTSIRPFNIEIDIVNRCNLRCVMCMMSHPSHHEHAPMRFPVAAFERLAEQVFWHVDGLSLTYGAEPLLHPEFARFLEIAHRHRIPRVYAVTNGLLLTEDLARAMVRHEMHSLVVSIDAARRETYERIRVGGDWDLLLRNLAMLQRLKRELGSVKPHLALAFVMMRANVRELPAFVELAKNLGASAVTALHMVPFEPLHNGQETCAGIKETTNAVLRAARATAARLQIQFVSPPEFGAAAPNSPVAEGVRRFGLPVTAATVRRGHCPFPWHFLAIDMNGNVIPCGWWQGGAPMGNIHEHSFETIWHGDAYRTLRSQHRTHELCPTCRRCPAAGIGSPDDPASFTER